MEKLPCAVVVHDHIHLRGAHKNRVEVYAYDMLGQKLVPPCDQRFLFGGLAAAARLNGIADLFEHVIHCRDQESAGAHCRIKDNVVFRRVDHAYHHVTHVSWREELPLVAAQVGANDRLVGMAFNVHITLEQGIHL